MDWIPKPANAVHRLPSVRCLNPDGPGYDHNPDWNDYPARQGYAPKHWVEWVNFFAQPPSGFDAFLERWLFWGQIERTLNIGNIDPREYTSPMGNIRISAALRRASGHKDWTRDMCSWGVNEGFITPFNYRELTRPPKDYPSLSGPFKRSPKMPMDIFCRNLGGKFRDPRSCALIWATTLFAELAVLDEHRRLLAHYEGDEARYRGRIIVDAFSEQVEAQPAVVKRLLHLGWCPWEVHMLAERFNMLSCFYISQMQRPDPTTLHPMSEVPENGEGRDVVTADSPSCNASQCLFKAIDEATYQTAHTGQCTDCEFVAIDTSQLVQILQDDQIPVVPIESLIPDTVSIQLVAQSDADGKTLPYIAFSHVWSDGLGNQHANSMLHCQLQRLKRLVEQYNLKAGRRRIQHFWLDALCVPPSRVKMPAIQRRATHKMRDTYEQATAVLVLDKWLTDAQTQNMTASEKLMRVVCSPWTRRLWTLQEGLLAPWNSLFFVFNHDRLFNADYAWEGLQHFRIRWPWMYHAILKQIFARYQDIRGDQVPNAPISANVEVGMPLIIRSMKFRSTSVASDEALCLSVIMKLDTLTIARTPDALRMETLWRMVTEVSFWLLFWSFPRLSSPGLRWAPATLLHPQGTFGSGWVIPNTSGFVATTSINGLQAWLPGVTFHVRTFDDLLGRQIWLRNASGKLLAMLDHASQVSSMFINTIDKRWWGSTYPIAKASEDRRRQALIRWGRQFAILWLMRDPEYWLENAEWVPAVLVAVEKILDDSRYFVHLVEGVGVAAEYWKSGTRRALGHLEGERAEAILDSTETAASQGWIID